MASDDKNLWRERWLACINELTSFDLQKRSWLDKTNTNPHWSFVEFLSNYFDDLGIEDSYEYPLEKGWLTSQEFEIIKDWHETLINYRSPRFEDYNHDAILNDPSWLAILQKGLDVKNRLALTLTEIEGKILTRDIQLKSNPAP